MLNIVTNTNKNLLITIENWICLFETDKKDPIFEHEHNVTITHGVFLPIKNLIIFTDLNKKLVIFDVNTKACLATRTINKRASKLIYSKEESALLIGDKTGDVYLMKLNLDSLNESEIKLLMGSLSMLTDMKFNTNEKYIITSDRDEKIRISSFPNSYNINSYLLGHKEFISQIELISDNRLLSGSGDSTLILWNIEEAKIVQKIDLAKHLDVTEKLKGVFRFDYDYDSNRIIVQLFGKKFLLKFNYNPSADKEEIQFVSKIDINDKINNFVGLSDDLCLFVHLDKNSEEIFSIKKIDSETSQMSNIEPSHKNEALISITKLLTEKIKTKNIDAIRNEMEKEYLNYFKAIINNLDEYYDRKSKRIMAKEAKRQRTESDHPEVVN